MLLDSSPKLEDLIVELLSREATLNASAIQNHLLLKTREFTIQAIYKALHILESSGVVVKHKQKYALSLSWVSEVMQMARSASLHTRRQRKAYLPKPGKRIIWHFNELHALNNFWAQILLLMISGSENRSLYTWMPHPWFHLAYSEQEEQYIRSLEYTNTRLYLINGGNCFLDRWAEKYWKKDKIEYSSSPSSFHDKERDRYVNVFEDYVLTVKLDEIINAEIENFYRKIQSFDDLDFSEVFRIFGLKVKSSMWLENNPEKAARYKKKFSDYFGIK